MVLRVSSELSCLPVCKDDCAGVTDKKCMQKFKRLSVFPDP